MTEKITPVFVECDAQTEKVARALCVHEKCDPDRIVPGQECTFYGVGGSVKAVKRVVERHPLWWHFVSAAQVAMQAMSE